MLDPGTETQNLETKADSSRTQQTAWEGFLTERINAAALF